MTLTLLATWQPAAALPEPVRTPHNRAGLSLSPVLAGLPPDGIATARELGQRLEQRAKPECALEFSPPGQDGIEALRQAENQNERRIAHLRSRLETAHERLQVDHSKAQRAGQAMIAFERSR